MSAESRRMGQRKATPANGYLRWMRGTGLGRALAAVALLAGLQGAPLAQNICASGASLANPRAGAQPLEPGAGGIGGTGAVAGRPGLGGTGIDPGGIGGTGAVAGRPDRGSTAVDPGGLGGTGIVGVITGFASICVNGLEVHFDDATPISDAGEPVPARQLAVGQLVAVQARGQGDQLTATRIALLHTAVGPIDALDAVAGRLELLGQTVEVDDRHQLAGLRAGDWVRVSGLRQAQGTIAASRLEAIDPQAQVQLTGVVEGAPGGLTTIGGARVRVAEGQYPAELVKGREVTVTGRWDGKILQASRVVPEPTRQGIAGTGRVVLEGFVHAAGAREIDLGHGRLLLGAGVQLPVGGLDSLSPNQRVRVQGAVGPDSLITLDRVELSDRRGEGATGRASDTGRSQRGRDGRSIGGGRDADRSRDRPSDGRGSDDGARDQRSGSDDGGKSTDSSGSGSGSSGSSDSSGSGSGSSGSNSGSSGSGGSGSSGGSGGSGSGGSGGGGRSR